MGRFNATKCNIMRVTWKRTSYSIINSLVTGEPVQKVAPLATTLNGQSIFKMSLLRPKGNSKLAFLRRNLRGYQEKLKEIVYFSLVTHANTCRASYTHIRKIKSIGRYLNEQTTRTLVNATVLS